MGNRAVITTKEDLTEVGIYLHRNGGRSSVEAFLAYCKMKGYRKPEEDNYGWAYLTTVCGCFFGDGRSLGVDVASKLDCDNYDNGVYIIKDWMIIGRRYLRGEEQLDYDLKESLESIDRSMPEKMRLTDVEWQKFDEVKAEVMAHREG